MNHLERNSKSRYSSSKVRDWVLTRYESHAERNASHRGQTYHSIHVEEAVASGIGDIIIVTGKGKRAIEDHFDRTVELEEILLENRKYEQLNEVRNITYMADIHYIRQRVPLGLGHAVWCARRFIGDEPFAVLLGDDIVRGKFHV